MEDNHRKLFTETLQLALKGLPDTDLGNHVYSFMDFYREAFFPGSEGAEYGQGASVSRIPLYDLVVEGKGDKIRMLWHFPEDIQEALPLMQNVLESFHGYIDVAPTDDEYTNDLGWKPRMDLHETIDAVKTFDDVAIKMPRPNVTSFPPSFTKEYE